MISIIIPVLNEAETIAIALNRLLSQRGTYEVIVVDGGSTDGTLEAIKGVAVRQLTLPPGRSAGIGAQINHGAQQARGDVLVFLHIDVQLPNDAIALIQSTLMSPDVAGGGFVPRFSRSAHRSQNIALALVEHFWQRRTRRLVWFAGDTAPYVRTANFNAAGGYPNTAFASDWDWAWKLKTIGRLVAVRNPVIVDARRHIFNGVIKTLLVTGSIEAMYHLGVDRLFLRRWYRKWLPRER